MKPYFILLLVVLSVAHSVQALGLEKQKLSVDAYSKALQKKAFEKKLWRNRYWINLLHYRPSALALRGDSYSSYVDDEKFFLSREGATHPEAELLATLRGFFEEGEGDNHPQCRFPARLDWLSQQLNIVPQYLPKVDCPLYKQWRDMVNVEKVVLVFPAHHLNSPSSMFGHTLLRLDPPSDDRHSDWLAYGVNFGANIPAGDNSLLYAYKGLSGGYPGQFIVEPYFKKIQEYNRVENRDIWEYPLNLTPHEARRLSRHLWELKNINFAYYFFKENCSYRLLELLEVARPSAELTDEFVLAAIPIDTVRTVERAGFITDHQYRPSIATQLHFQLSALPGNLRPLLVGLAENEAVLQSPDFLALSPSQQYRVVQTAYHIVRYRQAKKGRDPISAKHSLALLTALSTYPARTEEVLPVPVSPEKAHQSKRLTLSRGHDDSGNYSELGFRMAYHSLLDNPYGFLDGAQINMGAVGMRVYDDNSLKLERFDVADVFSLTPNDEIFDSLSWRVYGGLERVNTKDERPLVTHVSGGGGYAHALGESTFYGLLGGRIENNKVFKQTIDVAMGPELGWVYKNPLGVGALRSQWLEFAGSERRIELGFEQNMVLSINHALRFKSTRRWYNNYTDSEFSLSYHYFFK